MARAEAPKHREAGRMNHDVLLGFVTRGLTCVCDFLVFALVLALYMMYIIGFTYSALPIG